MGICRTGEKTIGKVKNGLGGALEEVCNWLKNWRAGGQVEFWTGGNLGSWEGEICAGEK